MNCCSTERKEKVAFTFRSPRLSDTRCTPQSPQDSSPRPTFKVHPIEAHPPAWQSEDARSEDARPLSASPFTGQVHLRRRFRYVLGFQILEPSITPSTFTLNSQRYTLMPSTHIARTTSLYAALGAILLAAPARSTKQKQYIARPVNPIIGLAPSNRNLINLSNPNST